MPQELIHFRLLYSYEIVIEVIWHHQTITGIPKQYPKEITEATHTVCYAENMTTTPKGKTVDTTNIQ